MGSPEYTSRKRGEKGPKFDPSFCRTVAGKVLARPCAFGGEEEVGAGEAFGVWHRAAGDVVAVGGEPVGELAGRKPALPRFVVRAGLMRAVLVDDQHAAAGTDHAAEFRHGAARQQGVFERLDGKRTVERAVAHRNLQQAAAKRCDPLG